MTSVQSFDWAAGRGVKWREQLAGMEAMLAPVDEPLIRALRLDRAYRIADLGCGGGGTTREVARRAPPGSVVHGFDISPALIEAARVGLPGNAGSVEFAVADVSLASAPSGPYDRLLSRFGVMFYDDPPAAFANVARWLAPGGRFAFAVWGRANDNPWLSMIREAAAEVVDLPTPDPDAPGPLRYADADKLLSLLARVGFVELEVRNWRGTFAIGGGLPALEAARFALRSSSVAEPVIAAGEQAFERALHALSARFAPSQEGQVVSLGACVQIVTGARSERR
ncbi:MAG TPA: methyltransferase domain-containing protein, partial [Polyangiaceae bacterium]|nr:methyltransferase domain-containing protein [Polyangiaceae bacterium]